VGATTPGALAAGRPKARHRACIPVLRHLPPTERAVEDPWSHPDLGAGEPGAGEPGAGEAAGDEAQVLRELQEALRGCLADLRQGVGEIRAQLAQGVAELRDGAEPRSLAIALANLEGFFGLLAQMNESFEGRSLPALDRLDAAVNDGARQLETSLEAGAADALATGVETGLLTAFDVWPAAAEELDLAIGALAPDFLDAGA